MDSKKKKGGGRGRGNGSQPPRGKKKKGKHTFEKRGGEVNADGGVPTADAALLGGLGDGGGLDLLELGEDAGLGAEADDDLGHAQQVRLDPEPHELALEVVHPPLVPDLRARLELHPVRRRAPFRRLRVPYCCARVTCL